MTQIWRSNPQFKIEVTDDEVAPTTTTITNDQAIQIQVIRPENNISHAIVVVDDYKSKNYVTYFDPFHTLEISLRYNGDSWTKVFSGMINCASPTISKEGEKLEVTAWGWEWALLKTHCNTSYGSQSAQLTVGGHPQDIIRDILSNYVNKAFGSGGASTQWNLNITDVDQVDDAAAITYLNCLYTDNFSAINRVCEIVNAYAGESNQASCHWYVGTDKHFRFKRISEDSSDGEWDSYWGGTSGTDPGTAASSTIVVHEDMIQYDFRKNIDEYANKVVLYTDLRVPGYDYWTEGNADTGLWGEDEGAPPDPHIELSNSAVKIVGSTSLRAEQTQGAGSWFWYPAGQNLAWNFENVGSSNRGSIPHLNFYARRSGAVDATLHLCTDDTASGFNQIGAYFTSAMSNANTWYHFSFPIGPYAAIEEMEEENGLYWNQFGAGTWTDIDFIRFYMNAAVGTYLYLDDLHISGKIIREAKDTSEITATKCEHQKILRCDAAVDDLFKSGTPTVTDIGTAARITYAELLRRSQAPTVGLIQIPLAPTILPGQKIHTHAGEQSLGSFRIDSDMRIKELRHNITVQGGITQLNLTTDVSNTFAFGVPNAYSLLVEQLQGMNHGQARDLKSGGVDTLISRLAESY